MQNLWVVLQVWPTLQLVMPATVSICFAFAFGADREPLQTQSRSELFKAVATVAFVTGAHSDCDVLPAAGHARQEQDKERLFEA